ncbi:replication-relaxation family protein (plasmid) [Streptomyces sp. NBC_01508]
MGTTQQLHRVLAPRVRIEQTRRRLAKLRAEGLVDRVTLPQAGRLRAWFPTGYGVRVAMEWPELRGRRAPRRASRSAAFVAACSSAARRSCALYSAWRALNSS